MRRSNVGSTEAASAYLRLVKLTLPEGLVFIW